MLGLVAPLWAAADELEPQYGQFVITFDGNGMPTANSGGDGYTVGVNDEVMGPWFYYEDYNWWNQWWYDHPYDPARYKEIELTFGLSEADCGSWIDVTLNWSLPEWSPNPDMPPLPGDAAERYIDRAFGPELGWQFRCETKEGDIFWVVLDPLTGESTRLSCSPQVSWTFCIWDYNPEWVSVDVRGENVTMEGSIRHECLIIPEPATIGLLGIGLAGLVVARLRRLAG